LFKKITEIVAGNLVTLVNLIVDLLCQFDIFRDAFNILGDAISEADTLRKWNLIGKFVGKLLTAVAVRRLKI